MFQAKLIKQYWNYPRGMTCGLYQCFGGPLPEYVLVMTDESSYLSDKSVSKDGPPETCIIRSNEKGMIVSWRYLPGSFTDGQDAIKALNLAGYQVE